MKRLNFTILCVCFAVLLHAQVSKTVNVATAGTLSSLLTTSEKNTVTDLTVTGTINSYDVYMISSSMPNVEKVDLEQSTLTYGSKIEFSYHKKLTAIKLPQTVITISFNGCSSLASIEIPPSVQSLDTVFSGCSSLKTLRIPASVERINGRGFVSSGITEFVVDSNNVTFSSRDGVVYSKKFETLVVYPPQKYGQYVIPPSITSILNNAFCATDSLTTLIIPSTATNDMSNLKECRSVQEFLVDSGNPRYSSLNGVLYSLGMDSLLVYPAKKYGDFVVPASVRYINSNAFINNRGLHSITLNKYIVSSSIQSLFNNCGSLTSITVEEGNAKYASLNGVLYNQNKDTLFFCPRARSGQYQIPQKVTTIYKNAFFQCNNITSLSLPSSVTNICDYAFYSTSLSSIRSYINPPISISNDVFPYAIKSTCVLSVPQGARALYLLATGWNGFKNIVEVPSFRLSSDSLHFTSKPENVTVRILSDTSWTAETDQSWLTITPDSVTTGSVDTVKMNISVLANKGLARKGSISLMSINGVQKRISVSQEGDSVSLIVSPVSVHLSRDSASMDTVFLTSGSAWTTSKDQNWFNVYPSSGAAGTTSLIFKSLSDNTSSSSREAHLTINSGTSGKEVLVTQNGTPDIITLSDSGLVFQSFQYYDSVVVLSAFPWTVTNVDSSWVTVRRNENKLIIQCKPNTDLSSRTTVLSLTTSAGSVAHLYITQKIDPKQLLVSPDSVTLSADSASSKSVYINSNTHWNATIDKPWLRLSSTSGNGSMSLTIQTTEPNMADTLRKAIITISADTITKIIRVTQSKYEVTVEYFKTTFPYQSGVSRNVKIATNTTWTASSNQSWLQVSPISGTGNATVTLTTKSANSSFFSSRSATLQITVGKVVKTFTITQNTSSPQIAGGDTLHSCQDSAMLMCNDELGAFKYVWSNASNASRTTVYSPGWYSVTITNEDNETVTDSVFVLFDTKLDFSIDYKNADSLGVLFTPSLSTIDSLSWDFGDGVVSKLMTPEHEYQKSGSYNVNLTATTEYSCRLHKTRSIKAGTLFDVSSLAVQLSSDSASMDTVFLTTGSAWTTSKDQNWFNVSPSSGVAGTTSLIFKSLSANTSSSPREAKFSIISSSTTKLITVTQDKQLPVLSVSDDTLNFSFYNSYDSLEVATSLSWVATVADSSWMSVVRDKNMLYINCKENTSQSSRRTVLIISTNTGVSKRVMIVQLGKEQINLSIANFDPIFAADSGLTKRVRIISNTVWTTSSDQPWLTINHLSGYGNDSIVLKTLSANDLFVNRVAKLQVTAGTVIRECIITQNAHIPQIEQDTIISHDATVKIVVNGAKSILYKWSNGGVGNQITVNKSGWYGVTMVDVMGNTMKDSVFVQMTLVAVISKTVTGGDSLTVQFTATGTGFDKAYWTFGDGTTFTGTTVQHRFEKAGKYNVCLTVINNKTGQNSQTNQIVNVGKILCTISANFTSSVKDKTVNFAIPSHDSLLTYSWSFGDNKTTTIANPTHTYNSAGLYLVSLSVRETTTGCMDYFADFVQVGKVGCKASFSTFVDVDSLKLICSNTSTGDNLQYYWNFGDGTYSSEQSPRKKYAHSGLYNINLVVSNNGCADYLAQQVQVGAFDCSSDFTVFVDSARQIAYFESSPIGDVTKYFWMFGDGNTSSKSFDSHIYKQPGYYNVSLNTYNQANNCVDTKQKTILVSNDLNDCEADFYYSSTGDNIQFFDKSLGLVKARIWNFGDDGTSTSINPIHQFTTPGYRNVCLTITNARGISNTTCKSIPVLINNDTNRCKARMEWSIIDTLAHELLYVDRSNGNINKITWSIDDSGKVYSNDYRHTFLDTGLYIIKHEVMDSVSGCYDREYNLTSITNNSSAANLKTAFVVEEKVLHTKSTANTFQFYGLTTTKPAHYLWDFGDGIIDSTSISPQHTYSAPGTYHVCLSVADVGVGLFDSYCYDVLVAADQTTDIKKRDTILKTPVIYPNPCDEYTTIHYNLSRAGRMQINIFSVDGTLIQQLVNATKNDGDNTMLFDASRLVPGEYFIDFLVEGTNHYTIMLMKK